MHRIHNEFRSPAPRHIVGFYMRSSHINRADNVCNRAWLRGPHWLPFILRSSQHNARFSDGIEYLYYLIYDDEYIYIHFNELRISFVRASEAATNKYSLTGSCSWLLLSRRTSFIHADTAFICIISRNRRIRNILGAKHSCSVPACVFIFTHSDISLLLPPSAITR